MKAVSPSLGRNLPLLVIAATLLNCGAAPFQLVSMRDPLQGAPAGGSGDSYGPILTPNGRYVLFASTANNLMLNVSNNPISPFIPARLNVFLRDRTNGTTSLASLNLTGAGGGNADSLPLGISTNGRYALFESTASNLVAGDTNNAADIFVRDLLNGATLLVSGSTDGGFANGVSRGAAMTPDGRYVAFVSAGNNLVANDTNGIADVFVRDLQTGTTTLVSVGAKSTNSPPYLSTSESPEISDDGRYVAFYSTATNLVPGVSLVGEIYLRDVVGASTIWASTNARALAPALIGGSNVVSYNHALSADGKFVAFEASTNPATISVGGGVILRFSVDSGLTDLVHTNAAVAYASAAEDIHNLDLSPDGRFVAYVAAISSNTFIYLWDAQSGTNKLISGTTSNTIPAGSACDWPSVDASGRYVAFLSSGTNLVTNSLAGEYHIYVRDVQAGSTTLVDRDTNGIGSSVTPSTVPRMSVDGRLVAFESLDANLAANDRNHDFDIFIRDLDVNAVELVSARHPALPSASANGPSSLSTFSVSADGRYVAFSSDADNLVPNDTNAARDIFVRDLFASTTFLVSAATNGATGDSVSSEPAIGGNGRYVAFVSSADNLVAGDTNRAEDVFVRDSQFGTTLLVSVNMSGTGPANKASYSPVISRDGRYVLFRSKASNLAAGSFAPGANLFFRDVQLSVTYALTTNGVVAAAMTPDGRYVAFNPISYPTSYLYLWDSQTVSRIFTNTTTSIDRIAISPDTSRIVYFGFSTLRAVDRLANSNWIIANPVYGAPPPGLRFSADSRFMVYDSSAGYTNRQILLYDFNTRTSTLVSKSFDLPAAGNGNSDSPDLSADGRFIVYRSSATNLVPAADSSGLPDLFLHDRSLGTTTLLTSSRFSGAPADNRSLSPVFSGDGHTLLFQTWASDVAQQDFNHGGDVVALAFLYATIVSGSAPAQGPTLTWPARPGETYQVQMKNTLNDSNWLVAAGAITIVGNQAQFTDNAPAAGQRFYRIVAF